MLVKCDVDQTNNSKIEIFGQVMYDQDLIGMQRGRNGCKATLDTGRE